MGQMRGISVALLGVLLCVGPARAAERQWQVRQFPESGSVTLVYDTPGGGEELLGFYCNEHGKQFSIAYYVSAKRFRDNEKTKMTLSSEAGTLSWPMTAGSSQTGNDLGLSAETTLTPALISLLSAGSQLTIAAKGRKQQIPLAGIESGLADLKSVCKS